MTADQFVSMVIGGYSGISTAIVVVPPFALLLITIWLDRED